MAERGVDETDDSHNPFSFKAFINDKDKKPAVERDIFSDDEDEEDIFATKPKPASSAPPRQPPQSQAENIDFDLPDEPPDDKPKDNPFSFKKFLSSSSGPATAPTATKPKSSLSSYGPPDIASDIPSFTHNYFVDDGDAKASPMPSSSSLPKNPLSQSPTQQPSLTTKTKTDSTAKKKKEPSSSLSLSSSLSSSSRNKNNKTLKNSPRGLSIENDSPPLQLPLFDNGDDKDDDDFDFGDANANGRVPPNGLQLPDFLSDGPLLGGKRAVVTHHPHHCDRRGDSIASQDDLLGQIHTLQEENRKLNEDLSRMKQKYDDKNQRISQLKSDLERQKKKEAEETAVMEKAVMQVEENLVSTTQRAVQAEATVTKLKQEVKTLQTQVRCLTVENEAYRSGDGGMSDIRERTKYTSQQLKVGADAAEKSLKELLQGVEQMKLLSQVLASWEKVTEVTPEADAGGNA